MPQNTSETSAPGTIVPGVLDAVDFPVIIIDNNCLIVRFNRAAAAVLHLTPSHTGQSVSGIVPEPATLNKLCADAIADGTPCRTEAQDGGRRFLIRIAPYEDCDRPVAGAVLTFTNVTAFRASIDQAIYEREYTKAILNTVVEPLVVLDAALRLQSANRAFYTIFGLSREETQGVPFPALGDDGWKTSPLWAHLSAVLSQPIEFHSVELERDCPRIGRRIFVLEARRLCREGSAMLLLVFKDVTEQKKAQEAVLQRTAQFQTLLNEAPMGVYLIDGNFRIREVNPTAILTFGNIPDLIGRDFDEIIHVLWPNEYADDIVTRFRHTLDTGEPYAVPEWAQERRDCAVQEHYEWQISRIPLPEGGWGVVCYFREISTLVRAREEMEKSERQLRKLAETIPQLVWTCLPDGNCDYLSAQWVAYTGIPEAEQLGLRWLDLVMHPDDRQRSFNAWMTAVADRGPYDIEYRLKRFDGVYRCFRTRGTPLRNNAGTIEKWFGTCTDIEDQKVAERHMLEQQKRESLGLLAGGVAHDFNNLLVGVLGNASMMDETLDQKHPLRPMVQGIVEAAERAAHLTRQMLAYAGKGRIFVQHVDLNALVRSTQSLVDVSFPKSVRLILDAREQPLFVEADSSQIQQVIMNLAINGAEAIGEDRAGSVRIGVSCIQVGLLYLSEHSFIGDAPREGTYACIEVEDTGSGIESDTLSKIFDPFFTTKFTGRGLGLAAVLGIVRSGHGALEVTSRLGHGTRFRVLLPALAGSPAIEIAEQSQPLEKTRRRPTVLVIDDEDIVRQTTRTMLTQAGYSVLLAENGHQGLEIFNSSPPAQIAVIILDMSMPGMSGKETLSRLRKRNDSVPVLIFSGFSEEQVHHQFGGLNISGFVQKPFTRHRIASAVHAVISEPVERLRSDQLRRDT